jgi:hypothetical protein
MQHNTMKINPTTKQDVSVALILKHRVTVINSALADIQGSQSLT